MTYSMKETSSQCYEKQRYEKRRYEKQCLERATAKGATARLSRVATLAANISPSPLGWQSVVVYAALSVCAIATYAEFLHYVL